MSRRSAKIYYKKLRGVGHYHTEIYAKDSNGVGHQHNALVIANDWNDLHAEWYKIQEENFILINAGAGWYILDGDGSEICNCLYDSTLNPIGSDFSIAVYYCTHHIVIEVYSTVILTSIDGHTFRKHTLEYGTFVCTFATETTDYVVVSTENEEHEMIPIDEKGFLDYENAVPLPFSLNGYRKVASAEFMVLDKNDPYHNYIYVFSNLGLYHITNIPNLNSVNKQSAYDWEHHCYYVLAEYVTEEFGVTVRGIGIYRITSGGATLVNTILARGDNEKDAYRINIYHWDICIRGGTVVYAHEALIVDESLGNKLQLECYLGVNNPCVLPDDTEEADNVGSYSKTTIGVYNRHNVEEGTQAVFRTHYLESGLKTTPYYTFSDEGIMEIGGTSMYLGVDYLEDIFCKNVEGKDYSGHYLNLKVD